MPDAALTMSDVGSVGSAASVKTQPEGYARLPVTFVVLTKDEEQNLPGCLHSIAHLSDDIHVLDSGSVDGTVDVVRSFGLPVYFHPFKGFGDQRNWAIDHIPHRYDWVFHLDADERMTDALAQEVHELLSQAVEEAGFFVPNKLMFQGQWLRRAGGYPTYQVRFFHRKRLRFIDQGHGQREIADGQVGYLTHPYVHEAFSKGLDEWLQKHSRYALREAEQYLTDPSRGLIPELASLISGDRVARRRAVKRLSFRLPFRSLLRFLEVVLVRRAFLDGPAGLAYARILSAYEAMIAAHLAALRCRAGTELRSVGAPRSVRRDLQELTARRPR